MVPDLNPTLYRAAKADPNRRFHALRDKATEQTSWGERGRPCAGIGAHRESMVALIAAVASPRRIGRPRRGPSHPGEAGLEEATLAW